MNCRNIYNNLIAKAQHRNFVEGYFECHHIIPKSLGGSNDQSNLVNLTAREHFIAHFLLAKIHGGNQWTAIKRFRHGKRSYCNSRLYEVARKNHAIQASKLFKGVSKSLEHISKVATAQKGRVFSKDHLLKLKISNSSEEVKFKKSIALLGKKRSAEDIAKMKQGWAIRKFKKECIVLNTLIDSIFQRVPNGA